MKKNVIENQFKDKMNTREIVPSKASWDRLDAMLTVAEKPKKNFKWLYVAASFLGFLLIGNLFFNLKNEKNHLVHNTLATNKPNLISKKKTISVKLNIIKKTEPVTVIREQSVSKVGADSNKVFSDTLIQIAKNEVIKEEQEKPIINQKAEQKIIPKKLKYVNIDELLASVDNASVNKNHIAAKSNIKVNSNRLLTQVDGELDLTFREKAIKTVNQNFKTVKLALSNRNSE